MKLNREGVQLNAEERNKRNQNWATIEIELDKAADGGELAKLAQLAAEDAKTKVGNVQQQVNELTVSGDSSPQATQASIGADGTSYGGNLKARLDAEQNAVTAQLAETAAKDELEVEKQRINNLIAVEGSTDNAETADIRIGADAITYSSAGEAVRKQVSKIKTNLTEQYAKVRAGKNLYDPSKNQSGIVAPYPVGSKQLVDSSAAVVWQKILISNANDYVLTGFRVYSITDVNDTVLKQAVYTEVADANGVTLLKANLPASSHFLWVSTYLANATSNAQIEIGQIRTSYEPYKSFAGLETNGKLLPVVTESEISDSNITSLKTWSSEKISTQFSGEFYNSNSDSKKMDQLTDKLSILEKNLESMYGVRKEGIHSSQTVNVKTAKEQKMLLHLHKRANDGYDTANDIYLPDAENDFSDVRVKTNDGKILPYHVVYKGNIDIIPDKRLGMNGIGIIFTNSSKEMIQTINGYISKSSDNGKTWQRITALDISTPVVVNVIGDVIFFSKNGILYRSAAPYTSYVQVLNTSVGYTGVYILSTSMVRHPDGELFLGSYQLERVVRIYKSTDNGLTWNEIYNIPTTYQHVHNMSIDVHSNPIAIYAGVDGGGGVLKSTDKGATWVDLKTLNANMPQSTDYGVIFASENGYRLLGGETAIVGGYSIIKTEDDLNYRPVLGVGNSVYMVRELNGKLFAGTLSANSFKTTSIMVSEDEGETWNQAYTTQPLTGAGASDGFRYMSKDIFSTTDYEQILVGSQSNVASPMRIVSDENSYYAEIIVDVPQDCLEIIVESGYVTASETLIYNNFEAPNQKILSLKFNEGGKFIKEIVSGKIIEKSFLYHNIGKHLSTVYPYMTATKDRQSVKLSTLGNGIVLNTGLSPIFTISFWGRLGYGARFNLIGKPNDAGNNYIQVNNHQLNAGIVISTMRFPVVPEAFSKYDIVVDSTAGNIKSYENGRLVSTSSVNITSLLSTLVGLTSIEVLKVTTANEKDAIQHFEIYNGALTETHIYNSYHSYISDNQH